MSAEAKPPESEEHERPWVALGEAYRVGDEAAIMVGLNELSHEEQRHAMAHLTGEEQAGIVELIDPDEAAQLLEHLPEAQAADILEAIAPENAADIVEELPEEVSADLLREMHDPETEALLAELDDEEEAEHLRELTSYEWDTAGGLMNSSFAAFPEEAKVGDVLAELSGSAERYGDMDVQYVYVVDPTDHLKGVLRLRDLVLTPPERPVAAIMLQDPISVTVEDDFESLRQVFEERNYIGLPVVDEAGVLAGVITKQAVEEATADHQTEDYLHSAGILGIWLPRDSRRSLRRRVRVFAASAWWPRWRPVHRPARQRAVWPRWRRGLLCPRRPHRRCGVRTPPCHRIVRP